MPTLSAALADTVIVPETVAPEIGAVTETVGGVVSLLATVTWTPAVAVFPAASRATAVREGVPFGTAVVFQAKVYGAPVSSAPRLAPSNFNWTPATPTSSEAAAATLTVPDTVVPVVGAVIETAGGVVSTLGAPGTSMIRISSALSARA